MPGISQSTNSLKFYSKKLGRHFEITDRDLRIFNYLHTFLRLDLEQLFYLDKVSEPNQKRFRDRLLTLSRAGCIHTFMGAYKKSPIFALLDKGLYIFLREKCVVEGGDLGNCEVQRITRPRHTDAEKIRRHEVGIADLALIHEQSANRQSGGFFVRHRDIFSVATDNNVRSLHKWPVDVSWNGKYDQFMLEPDYIAGTGFADRPAGHNVRYFTYEIDCSSEDMKPNQPLARGQSSLRKLLSYEVTIEQNLLQDYLGIEYFTPLFVFESTIRRDNFRALATDILTSRKAKDQMLFGLRPPRICEGREADFASLPWMNCQGKEVRVRL